MKNWLIVYDICDKRRLRQVAKCLEKYGLRVQKSVFECHLSTGQFKKLKSELAEIADEMVDSIRYYPLTKQSLAQVEILGRDLLIDWQRQVVV